MAPQRYASVRQKTRPVARITPFRDDTSLVAFRYEQTKQAKPPVILPPPRNPRRLSTSRPLSTRTTTTIPCPVVVAPPAFPPPAEEHPLFRTRRTSFSSLDEGKRDSGAPTSSSVTIREEYDPEVEFPKLAEKAYMMEETPYARPHDEISVRLASPSPCPGGAPAAGSLSLFTMPLRPATPTSSAGSFADSPPGSARTEDDAMSQFNAPSLSYKFGKSFSIRGSQPTKRLRKKGLADGAAQGPPGSPKLCPPPRPRRSYELDDKDEVLSVRAPSHDHDKHFARISTQIPACDTLIEDFSTLSFSNRGSVMLGGKRAINRNAPPHLSPTETNESAAKKRHSIGPCHPLEGGVPAPWLAPVTSLPMPPTTASNGDAAMDEQAKPSASIAPVLPNIRVLSADVERDSQKVRSLYESEDGLNWQDGAPGSSPSERLEPTKEVPSEEEENVVSPSVNSLSVAEPCTLAPSSNTPQSPSLLSQLRDEKGSDHERAGGLEDWEDVEGRDVDRYGFINQRRPASSTGSPELARPPPFSSKRRLLSAKGSDSAYSSSSHIPMFGVGRKISARSLNTHTSDFSTGSRRSARSSLRIAANHLPHNKNRRWMDEAGDMLSLQPGLTDIAEDQETGKIAESLKKKEMKRSEKWRKMAKVVKNGADGAATVFEFDVNNPKLIERTWKGIPDCWRAAAWQSFLATSAKTWKSQETDDELTAHFRRLQEVASPDDVQIDLDVPRTINRHIMFRRRYRGGQRLLFRVLHAISLYCPGTGYVQGMASLAATLLCYFDEEKSFVMMVRLWKYRGLERLYEPGFDGLMATLQDFEKHWLGDKDVASKLHELSIDATAYGIRWYLTLFNLSIPFPAQLRVWDVFMLLGECAPEPPPPSGPVKPEGRSAKAGVLPAGPLQGLDILHATSAALMHALRDLLLDSDFENAMKALTSWVPIKDEELLMKVTRAEWKQHQRKASGSKKTKS